MSLAILGTGRRVVDQDVGRLEISVDEVLLMDVAYSYQASAGAKGDHGSDFCSPCGSKSIEAIHGGERALRTQNSTFTCQPHHGL